MVAGKYIIEEPFVPQEGFLPVRNCLQCIAFLMHKVSQVVDSQGFMSKRGVKGVHSASECIETAEAENRRKIRDFPTFRLDAA